MTQYPEAWLARELGLCYANVSLVTDYDVGLEGMPEVAPVSADAAFAVFAENLDRLRALLFRAVPRIRPPAGGRSLRVGARRARSSTTNRRRRRPLD